MTACIMGTDRRQMGEGVEALHSTWAAAVVAAALFGHGERIGVPSLAVDRHHVGVAREDNGPLLPRARMGEERMFGLLGVDVAVTLDPVRGEVVGHPVDQGDLSLIHL